MVRRRAWSSSGPAVVRALFDHDRERRVLEPQGDLLQVLLAAGRQFGRVGPRARVHAELVVVEHEVGRLGVGLLRFPVGIADLPQGERPVGAGAAIAAAATGAVAVVAPMMAAGERPASGENAEGSPFHRFRLRAGGGSFKFMIQSAEFECRKSDISCTFILELMNFFTVHAQTARWSWRGRPCRSACGAAARRCCGNPGSALPSMSPCRKNWQAVGSVTSKPGSGGTSSASIGCTSSGRDQDDQLGLAAGRVAAAKDLGQAGQVAHVRRFVGVFQAGRRSPGSALRASRRSSWPPAR